MTLKELMIKGGIREGFREGTSKMADRPCYGYIKTDGGSLVIHEPEAKIVRWIFERYLAGGSLGSIANGLAEQGILSPTGKERWSRQVIDKLLSNEKYAGRVLLQKTYTKDSKQVRNTGQEAQYLFDNNNPAIVAEDVFAAIQAEKERRSRRVENAKEPENGQTFSL